MLKTVIGTFDTYGAAQHAVCELVDQGFSARRMSILAPKIRDDDGTGPAAADGAHYSAHGRGRIGAAASSAATGGMVGGAAGLFASLIWFILPGIGPIAASGPIVVALSGAAAGAVAGGLIAGLVELGVPEEHARQFSEALRRGAAMVTLRCDAGRAERAAEIMCDHGAVDIERRVEMWQKSQWPGILPRYAADPAGSH